jgi:ribonuclease PH
MTRSDRRKPDQLRPVRIQKNFAKHATGSCLIEMGNTRVICAVTVEEAVPRWMKEQKVAGGWITAEYSMLPYSTHDRKPRDITKGKLDGRSQEIQRLIGRAMRAVVDLNALGPRTLWIDCDVLQADGGTRTASITGAYVALILACKKLVKEKKLTAIPVNGQVAATSVGVVNGGLLLDLNYEEDSAAAVDMNIVMTDKGEFVEVQGTAEEHPFTESQMKAMLALAKKGIANLIAAQKKALRS